MRNPFVSVFARRARLTLWACLLLLFSAGAVAVDSPTNEDATPAAGTTASSPAPAADKPKQCYHGCQQWGEMCNVDPRGVYRCQRRCEKFGEVCE